jgi:hypothetical protein
VGEHGGAAAADESGGASGQSTESGGAGGEPDAFAGSAGAHDGGQGGDAGSSCASVDLPDDEFIDADCDGIDGQRSAGVFVSPHGDDAARGSIHEPVLTLGRAVEVATTAKLPVYVCNGTYRENLAIKTPVSIHGGYDCSRDWLRTKDHAVVESGAGLPLAIDSVQGKVLIDRIAFRALAGTAPGQSSQAAGIINTSDVTLVRVELQAGDGAPGAPGQAGARVWTQTSLRPAAAGTNSADCTTSNARDACKVYPPGGFEPEAVTSCSVDGVIYKLRGGRGGAGGNPWLTQGRPTCLRLGEDGYPGSPGEVAVGDGPWEWVGALSGQPGADGADGAPAAAGLGSLRGAVYEATNRGGDGRDGLPGFPGAGGLGGFGNAPSGDVCYPTFKTGAGGGQGAAGGCGGGRARGGGAGGGSVALVIASSKVELLWPRIVTGNGGRGGDGALGAHAPEVVGANGQLVTPPGAGGSSAGLNGGQPGSPGGRGGQGGDGGAGGGGPSIGVFYVGQAPVVSNAVYSLGLPGNGGKSESVGNAANGVTSELYQLAH